MSVTGLVHVNINCSDFERSLAFYELLGFRRIVDVPETNSADVAAAVGMPPYRLKGALLKLVGGKRPFVIDLLEWREPRDEAPPYPHLYHRGIARIAMATDDLDADIAKLREHGVKFVSEEPAVVTLDQDTSRFICFEDPDGTILELVE